MTDLSAALPPHPTDAANAKLHESSLQILRDKNLFTIITEQELGKTIVEELPTRKAIFLSLCSMFVDNGDHPHTNGNIIVNSESSAGKSYICQAICKLFPKHFWEWRTKISKEAFTYWHNAKFEPNWNWTGKTCYLEDAANPILNSESFKVMISEGSHATVVIKQRAIDIEIAGKPVMLVTTAKHTIPVELANRFSFISLDESPEQTRRIMTAIAHNKEVGEGDGYCEDVTNAFELLQRVKVVVPFAQTLTRFFPSEQVRMRRDFSRLLGLIEASAALHQMQRQRNEEGKVIATQQDYQIAKDCINAFGAGEIIGLTRGLKRCMAACNELYAQRTTELEGQRVCENKNCGWMGKDVSCPNCSLATKPAPVSFSAREIWAYAPFFSQQSWYENLDALTERGALRVKLVRQAGSSKPVGTYYPAHLKVGLELPDELQ